MDQHYSDLEIVPVPESDIAALVELFLLVERPDWLNGQIGSPAFPQLQLL